MTQQTPVRVCYHNGLKGLPMSLLIYIKFTLPETKGKILEEIENELVR